MKTYPISPKSCRRSPTYVAGKHPHNIGFDCFFPAVCVEDGLSEGVWYPPSLQCLSSDEAQHMSAELLDMDPSPFDRMFNCKAEGPIVDMEITGPAWL